MARDINVLSIFQLVNMTPVYYIITQKGHFPTFNKSLIRVHIARQSLKLVTAVETLLVHQILILLENHTIRSTF